MKLYKINATQYSLFVVAPDSSVAERLWAGYAEEFLSFIPIKDKLLTSIEIVADECRTSNYPNMVVWQPCALNCQPPATPEDTGNTALI